MLQLSVSLCLSSCVWYIVTKLLIITPICDTFCPCLVLSCLVLSCLVLSCLVKSKQLVSRVFVDDCQLPVLLLTSWLEVSACIFDDSHSDIIR